MRIGVDLDDVLADLISELIATHTETHGVALTPEQATSWSVFPPDVHERVRAHGYARLRPKPGAREFMQWLTERHEAHIVTYRNEVARSVTTAWLETHLPGCHVEVHFTGGSKVATCRHLRLELLIDDSCHQIPAVTEALGIPGILIDTPMNRHIPDGGLIRRATDLRAAREIVEKLARTGTLGPSRQA